jgi:hypothetical protein
MEDKKEKEEIKSNEKEKTELGVPKDGERQETVVCQST